MPSACSLVVPLNCGRKGPTAVGLKPDSTRATASSTSTGTPVRLAALLKAGSSCAGATAGPDGGCGTPGPWSTGAASLGDGEGAGAGAAVPVGPPPVGVGGAVGAAVGVGLAGVGAVVPVGEGAGAVARVGVACGDCGVGEVGEAGAPEWVGEGAGAAEGSGVAGVAAGEPGGASASDSACTAPAVRVKPPPPSRPVSRPRASMTHRPGW